MTAIELLKTLLDDGTYQLEKAIDGVAEGYVDTKPIPAAMSVREIVVHLSECYVAAGYYLRGEKFAWGTYEAISPDWPTVLAEFWRLRAVAIEAVFAAEEETAIKNGSDFLVSHDFYHVGQLATLRISEGTDWDPFSIYRH